MKKLVIGGESQLANEIKKIADDSYQFITREQLNICDKNQVYDFILNSDANVIINCAAYTQVNKAEDDKYTAYETNAKAVQHIAEAAKKKSMLLIHISTDFVFSGDKNTPYTELDEPKPSCYYGFSKNAGDELIKIVDCDHVIIRTSWLYSEYNTNFVKTMLQLFESKEQIKVIVDQIGTPTSATDLANTIVTIINSGKKKLQETYHYSNEGVASWFDFAVAIKDIVGAKTEILPCSSEEFGSKTNRPKYSVMDKSKIKKDFGIEIPYWRTSLKKLLSSYITYNKDCLI